MAQGSRVLAGIASNQAFLGDFGLPNPSFGDDGRQRLCAQHQSSEMQIVVRRSCPLLSLMAVIAAPDYKPKLWQEVNRFRAE